MLNRMQKGDTLIVSELSRLGRNLMQIKFCTIAWSAVFTETP
ncbi:hypothetical protein JHJ32_06580 [Parapedobacter sp. ISTM3]|nr:hypothetical protein [Parapedobacter sp. ISTM3]